MSGVNEPQSRPPSDDCAARELTPPGCSAEPGAALSDEIQVLDADGHVACDLQCLTCGYNLRTLRADSLCPECGNAVATAVQSVVESPRNWLGRMADGAGLCAAGLCFAALGFVIALPGLLFENADAVCAVPILGCLGGLMAALGIIGLTERRPKILANEDNSAARGAARVCLVFIAVGTGVGVLAFALLNVGGGLGVIALPFVAFVPLALAVLPPVLCTHVGRLMRRISRPDVAWWAQAAVYAVVALEALLLFGVLALLADSSSPEVWAPFVALLACLAILLILIVLLASASRALGHRIEALSPRPADAGEPVGPVKG